MTGIFSLVSLGLIIGGVVMMSNFAYTDAIDFSPYNVGLIMLILGISVMMFLGVAIFNLINAKKAIEGKPNEQI